MTDPEKFMIQSLLLAWPISSSFTWNNEFKIIFIIPNLSDQFNVSYFENNKYNIHKTAHPSIADP